MILVKVIRHILLLYLPLQLMPAVVGLTIRSSGIQFCTTHLASSSAWSFNLDAFTIFLATHYNWMQDIISLRFFFFKFQAGLCLRLRVDIVGTCPRPLASRGPLRGQNGPSLSQRSSFNPKASPARSNYMYVQVRPKVASIRLKEAPARSARVPNGS